MEKHRIFSEFLPANLLCAALLVLAQQVMDDVGRFEFRSDPCLLKLPNTIQAFQILARGVVLLDNSAKKRRGSYLFFNTVMQYWMRSGNASKTFGDSYPEHVKGSKLRH